MCAGPVRLLLLLLVPAAADWNLLLLHTNDVHARVEETSGISGKCKPDGRCFAGVARRATAVRGVRSRGGNVLLLDAGDQFQGTVWFNYYRGAEAAHFMNRLRYDAMALGNHEFDNGVGGLLDPFLAQIQCHVLSANIRTDPTLNATFGSAYSPYKVLHVGGEKVGVVGYTSLETTALSDPGPHVFFEDEVASLQPYVDRLQEEGVTKIIALGHSGFSTDQQIARKVRGVDVVVGGHTNTFLYTGPPPSSEVPAGPYPFLVQSDDGREVPVVQAYAFGKYLGLLNVTFDDNGNVLESRGNPILLDSSVPQDPEILAEVQRWKENLANYSSQVVGRTNVFLNGTNAECRFRECNLGNLICDAMVNNYVKVADEDRWNQVSAAIMNGGGIRSDIDEQLRDGWITMEDLIAVMPFGGTFDLVQLRGATLKRAFEFSVRRYGEGTGEFLQVSGFRVEYDLSRPPWRRLKSLRILCTWCQVPVYEPVEDQTVYTVVVGSYMAQGGDGFALVKNETLKHNSGDLDLTVVSDYIRRMQPIYTPVEGRISIHTSAAPLPRPVLTPVLLGLLWTLM
ncbi:5'-nucleotidase [Antennarius striatus]|uniref:5'-nucleotidase n=1 Tax=Antennarius striatus TaxID=241820 RepID=UPI0035AE5013